jgi:hypothetical protein
MAILEVIRAAWGWSGLSPTEVVTENDFGNLIVRDDDGRFWRICPEELDCKVVACDQAQLARLLGDEEFLQDWHMREMVHVATTKFKVLEEGRKFCLKIPGALGGEYDESNIGTISLTELVRFSGDLALQLKDLPDGAHVKLNIIG